MESIRLQAALGDRYRIERELGRGGFAVVYLAQDVRHDRSVALKVLHDAVAADVGEERFEREIRLAARLQHPHILGVFDSGTADGRLWFTMPFIEGESLRDRLQRERQLPVADAIGLAREVADALHYAHQHGVIHRDIKPENILLTGRHAMVADFGIARALGTGSASLTQTGLAMGSPGYMSPEQSTGERDLDARSDVYSLGCVLYEMLAGEGPFDAPTAQGRIARSLTEAPRPIHTIRPGVSEAVDAVLARALARVPADRFASADAFADAMLAVAPGPVSGVTTAPGDGAVQLQRSSRGRQLGIAAGALALVAALIVVLTQTRNADDAGRAVAVLPFESVGTTDDSTFADGITEEVRGKLTAVPGLRVTARASSNQYRGTHKLPRQIGGELNVQYILTGTVRWAAGPTGERRVRVTPELISTSSGDTKWQEGFDEVMSDVFKVQTGIATKVASALGATLGDALEQKLSERPTQNLEAYQEYLRGEKATGAMARDDGKSLAEGLTHYERAAALDTAFGLAWSRVALITIRNFSVNPTEENSRRATDAVARAARLAPDNPQVRRARARYYRIVKSDFVAAMAQIDSGLLREPNNVDLLTAASSSSALLSRWDAAVDYAKRAAALDPRSVDAADQAQRILHGVRRFAEADEYAKRALTLLPGDIGLTFAAVVNRTSMGDLPGAQRIVRDQLKLRADTTELVAYFALFQEMMWVLDEPLLRRITQLTPAHFRNNRQQWALKVGRTWLLLGDTARGRAYGDSSRVIAEAQLAAYPENAQLHELHGRALALMGRNADAIAEAEQSLKMRETALDATTGPYVRYQVARILVQAGAYDRALDIIEPLLTTNYVDLTPAWLRLEPVFRPLRGNARFERISRP